MATDLPSRVARSSFPTGVGRGLRLWAAGVLQQGRHHLLRGAPIGSDGIQAGHDGFLLFAPLLPLAQAHRGHCGRRWHHGHPFAIGLHHQDRLLWRWRRRLGRLLIAGADLPSSVRDAGVDGLGAERQPQDAFQHRLALAVGLIGRAINGPFLQQVGIATRRQAQLCVEGAEALLPRSGEGMPPKADFAKHRVVGRGALIVIGQTRSVGGGDWLRRPHGGTRHKEQPQQHRAQGQ
jgi:hypothetical protein